MTVAELIERLSAFPADMRVMFTADMGWIATSQPNIEVRSIDLDNEDDPDDRNRVDAVHIDVD